MPKIDTIHFGEIDLFGPEKALATMYDGEIIFEGEEITLGLHINHQKYPTLDRLDHINRFLNRLKELKPYCIVAIKESYDKEEIVKYHIDLHLKERTSDELSDILKRNDLTEFKPHDLIDALSLVNVFFCPERDEAFATFDFTLGRKYTDYVVVVRLNVNQEVYSVTFES